MRRIKLGWLRTSFLTITLGVSIFVILHSVRPSERENKPTETSSWTRTIAPTYRYENIAKSITGPSHTSPSENHGLIAARNNDLQLLSANLGNQILYKKHADNNAVLLTDPFQRLFISNLSGSYNVHPTHVDLFQRWSESKVVSCGGDFAGYDYNFAVLNNVCVIKNHSISQRNGGEFLDDVLNQDEKVEYIKLEKGFFLQQCPGEDKIIQYKFKRRNHLQNYLSALVHFNKALASQIPDEQPIVTVAVTRYEYANLYHTMTDWYNAFLMQTFMNATQVNIIIIDAHPRGALDPVWPVLFNDVKRLSQMDPVTNFKQLVWSIQGYNSPLYPREVTNTRPPLLEEFRSFFLHRYGIESRSRALNCSSLNALFIWRRDYVAHPRQPRGKIARKIHNEDELVESVRDNFPSVNIRGVQIDAIDFKDQLRLIVDTDVLIGMHGAGLTHAMFLPSYAGLLEMFPIYHSSSNVHFSSIARWRGLNYESYENGNPQNELPDKFTIIPKDILVSLYEKLVSKICRSKHTSSPNSNVPLFV